MFIQGGGFNKNSNSNYDGTGLVKAGDYGLIAITFNYRVGPYGFLTNGNQVKPNNGLKDQRKALEWIKKNIAQFGGDPNHVVLIGGSAGGASISLQLIAYGGKDEGLFHGAAATAVSFATVLTIEQSQYQYDNFAILAGCAVADSLACLRSKNTTELQAANQPSAYPGAAQAPLYMWNPVIDGDMLTELTYTAFEEGRFLHVPVIFGTSTNDGRSFVPRGTSTLGQSNTFLKDQFPYMTIEQLGKINDMYPNDNKTCPDIGCYFGQASAAYGDVRYMCPGMWISSIYEKFGQGSKSWNYRYDVEDPKQIAAGDGVPHTVGLPSEPVLTTDSCFVFSQEADHDGCMIKISPRTKPSLAPSTLWVRHRQASTPARAMRTLSMSRRHTGPASSGLWIPTRISSRTRSTGILGRTRVTSDCSSRRAASRAWRLWTTRPRRGVNT